MIRFSIRDVLWLTVVVGLGCVAFAGLHERRNLLEQLRERTERCDTLESMLNLEIYRTYFLRSELEKDRGPGHETFRTDQQPQWQWTSARSPKR